MKWLIISSIIVVLTVFVVRIIKVMLKADKDSKQQPPLTTEQPEQTYSPEGPAINLGSASNSIVTDMSSKPIQQDNSSAEYNFDVPENSGFLDELDDEFLDYRAHAKNRSHMRLPDDFDFEGDFADEYIPDSPEFSYIPKHKHSQKKPIKRELNELSTEMKVLMLSDIFDRKFFD